MLTALPMKHVLIQALVEDLPQIALVLAETGVFAPDPRGVDPVQFPNVPGADYRTLFHQACGRLDKILRLLNWKAAPLLSLAPVMDIIELTHLNQWLGAQWSIGSAYEEQLHTLQERWRHLESLEQVLDVFANLNIDLGRLQGERRFLNVLVGLLPQEHLRPLEEALGLAGYLLQPFRRDGGTTHVIIVGPSDGAEQQLDPVLQAADFRRLIIPSELHSQPDKVRQALQQQQQALQQERQDLTGRLQIWGQALNAELSAAQQALTLAAPFNHLESALRSVKHLAALTGWVPARSVTLLEHKLNQRLATPFLLTLRNPRADERPLVPTLLRSYRLLAPFAALVLQYGVPRYGEIDPTPLFAISFVLMFGMMFGDVGHGALITLIGISYRQQLRDFSPFAILAGLFSMLFGVLYGSVFGYETLIQPLWVAPLSDPLYMLTVALCWGIGFMVLGTLIAIYNHLVMGQNQIAFFGQRGLAGLVFYLAMLSGCYQVAQGEKFGQIAMFLVLISLIALMLHKWRENQAPLVERSLVIAIETLETLTGYLSNTLSFLRVAAFSLNHMALAIAVFTLADMMGHTGYWITVVLGNLFILILEGGIVMIQTIRLEYYEGFSRFYFGDGRAFQALTLYPKPAT